MCFHLESELSVVNNLNFLLRRSENISSWVHMLTFSVLEMWVSKWPFALLAQESLNRPPGVSCSLAHLFIGVPSGAEVVEAIDCLNSLIGSVLDTPGRTVTAMTRSCLQGS